MAKFWKNKKFMLVLSIFAVSALFLANILTKTDWQTISDERKAREYQPTAAITGIADDIRLTDKGKTIFYATNPQIQTAELFNQNCDGNEDNYSLGCYINDGSERIYLYDTENTDTLNENGLVYDLKAKRNTVALHELLHAAYNRLSTSEKRSICSELKKAVASVAIEDELAYYSDKQYCTEAFARVGSEHISAISGTKLADVYRRYFEPNDSLNRKIKANSDSLARLSQKIAHYDEQINLKEQTVSDYNLMVRDYNSLVDTYSKIASILDSRK